MREVDRVCSRSGRRTPRALPLLHRALESGSSFLVSAAIEGLAAQHVESSLPAIDRALASLDETQLWVVLSLALFDSDAADRIAEKYLSDDDRAEDIAFRAETKRNPQEAPSIQDPED